MFLAVGNPCQDPFSGMRITARYIRDAAYPVTPSSLCLTLSNSLVHTVLPSRACKTLFGSFRGYICILAFHADEMKESCILTFFFVLIFTSAPAPSKQMNVCKYNIRFGLRCCYCYCSAYSLPSVALGTSSQAGGCGPGEKFLGSSDPNAPNLLLSFAQRLFSQKGRVDNPTRHAHNCHTSSTEKSCNLPTRPSRHCVDERLKRARAICGLYSRLENANERKLLTHILSSFLQTHIYTMNSDKFSKLQSQVRIGGKGNTF